MITIARALIPAIILVSIPDSTHAINNPTNFVATAVSSTEIDITWKDRSTGESSFRIWRAQAGQPFSVLAEVPANATNYADTGQNLGAAYHVYGTWWTPQAMTFYVDGVQTGKTTTNVNRSNPMWYGVVNASAGGGGVWPNNSTQLPNHVLFDYVHVYSAQAGAQAINPEPGYGGPGDAGGTSIMKAYRKGQ